MFRLAAGHMRNIFRKSIRLTSRICIVRSAHCKMSAEELEKQYEDFFKSGDIDGWELRMGDLLAMDLLISPPVATAGLQACRCINDNALAIRWLKGVRDKCGDEEEEIYPYII